MRPDLEEWAEEHGYVHCICSRCGKHFWTDSGDPCPNGCFDNANEDENGDAEATGLPSE
jgi:hypothetical protein